MLDRIRTVPGVTHAGVTSTLPFSGSYSDSVILAEGYQMQKGESLISPSQVVASDGYFEAMGATLVAGRFFTEADDATRPKVLVIDDSAPTREFLEMCLTSAGCEVVTASSGVGAVPLVEWQKPDLVLLDIVMPFGIGRQGFEFVNQIGDVLRASADILFDR